MRKLLSIIMLLFLPSFLLATSAADKSGDITIDGDTGDFDEEKDQILLSPANLGRYYESDSDSQWGEYNEVIAIKVTWDHNYLYLAADGILEGDSNHLIIYLDTGQNTGVRDISKLSAYKRVIEFDNIEPNFFIAGKNTESILSLYKINSATSASVAPNFGGTSINCSLINKAYKSIEARINWQDIYGSTPGKVIQGATLMITGCITGGDDSTAVDAAPNTSKSLPSQWDESALVNNCLLIEIDEDGDSVADDNVKIIDRAEVVIDVLSLEKQAVKIKNLKIENQSFSPNDDGINDYVEITYELSKDAEVDAKVFNLEGDLIFTYQSKKNLQAGHQLFRWYGGNDRGIKQKPGLYIVNIKASADGKSDVKKLGIYLLN